MSETGSEASSIKTDAPGMPGASDRGQSQSGDRNLTPTPIEEQTKAGPQAIKEQKELACRASDANTEKQLPSIFLTNELDIGIAKIFQNSMVALAGDITPNCERDALAQEKVVDDRITSLKKENNSNTWGPESQRAERDYINWLENKAIPNTAADLKSNGIALPPGYPSKIPTNAEGNVVNDADYAGQITGGNLKVNLNIETETNTKSPTPVLHSQPAQSALPAHLIGSANLSDGVGTVSSPSLTDLTRLMAAKDWMARAHDEIDAKEVNELFARDKQKIGTTLPKTWVQEPGQDLEQYKAALRVGANLYNQLATDALAVDALRKLGDTHLENPAGLQVVSDGKGNITPVIDLPARLADLVDDPRTKEYVAWHEQIKSRIQQDTVELKLAQKNPYNNLLYGSIELPFTTNADGQKVSKEAVLNSKGNLVSIVDPIKEGPPAPPAGQDGKSQDEYSRATVDMLQQSFTAKRENPTDPNSDILIDITIQAQQGRPFAYDLLNKDIGQPMLMEQRHFKANDMVVYNGQLVQAKTLPDRLTEAKLLYAGGKAFNIALDASMFIGGSGLIAKTAINGLKETAIAAEAISTDMAVSGGVLLSKTMARATAETLAGAGGFIGNNAWGHNHAPGIDEARTPYFLTTGVAGISKSTERLLSGGEAVQAALQETGPAWLRTMTDISDRTMQGLMPVMGGQIALGVSEKFYHAYENATHKDEPDPLAEALIAATHVSEHTVLGAPQAKEVNALNDLNDLNGDVETKTLYRLASDYKAQFQSDSGGANGAQDILDTVGRWGQFTEAERNDAKKKWAANLSFTEAEIKALDEKNEGLLTSQQLRDLIDPQTRALMQEAVRTLAAQQLESRNADVTTASRMALLMTATSDDGRLPGTLVATNVNVGVHAVVKWEKLLGLPIPIPVDGDVAAAPSGLIADSFAGPNYRVRSRDVSENIDPQIVLNGLHADLVGASSSGKAMAVGDLLARAGALSPQQYSSFIQHKLDDTNTSAEDKILLLSTAQGPLTASVLDCLYQDQVRMQDPSRSADARAAAQAHNFGNSYQDLMKTLERTALSDPSETVRAMAATTFSGARQLSANLERAISANQELAAFEVERARITNHAEDPLQAQALVSQIAEQKDLVAKIQNQRKQIIDSMNAELSGAKNSQSGQGANLIENNAIKALEEPLPTDDATQAIQKRLDAAMFLSKVVPAGSEGDAARQQMLSSLVESFTRSNRSQFLKMMDTLSPEVLQLLSADKGFARQLLDFVPSPTEARHKSTQHDSIELLKQIAKFAGDAPTDFKSGLEDKLNALIQDRDSVSLSFPYVQAEAVRAASIINAQEILPSLEKLSADVDGANAMARSEAVKALTNMKDPALKLLIPDLLNKETDQRIHNQLLELSEQLSDITASAANSTDANVSDRRLLESAEIKDAYPVIADFNKEAQRKFLLDNKLSLLDHALFIKEGQNQVQANWGTNAMNKEAPDTTMADLFKDRQAQFQHLLNLAEGDIANPQTQMARAFLAEVAGNGQQIGDADTKYLLAINHEIDQSVSYYYDETKHAWPMVDNFDFAAAAALGKLANAGDNGVDLNSQLVGNLLNHPANMSIKSLLVLADSWQAIYKADAGHAVISTERYKYAINRAQEAAQQKQDALREQTIAANEWKASNKNEVTTIESRKNALRFELSQLLELQTKLNGMLDTGI